MVDLRTSARRPVLMTNIASLLVGFAMFANMLLTTQQLQLPAATGYGFGLTSSPPACAWCPPDWPWWCSRRCPAASSDASAARSR